ncbi:MAG: prepilin-type N-terminal cleavage/methylation domain-containing protein, partial [Thermodesulfobacteriota bacterium]|nr:prepilin-type N-terminal cleavage/methylation domain-containing protein [Thermodesulfobacteriota bacterium]
MKKFTEKGFTLVELMITVALIAIMALIAVPAFQRHAINANLKSATRDIASDFLLLKERAISEN